MPKLMAYSPDLSYGYALGLFPSHALLDARPAIARRLLLHSEAMDTEGVAALRVRCKALSIREEVADQALARISRKQNCYAAIVFDKYESTLQADGSHIVLHNPSDMGNLGTILRTCLGFEIFNVAIIRPAADVFDPRVVRASMGAMFSVNVQYFDDFDCYRRHYPQHALYPFMLDGAKTLRHAVRRRRHPFSLVFGNEATGLPPHFAEIGHPVRIPHNGRIDSLNLAVAVAIATYAFTESDFYEVIPHDKPEHC